MNKYQILTKIAELIKKWKNNVPEKDTNMWWRWRADQALKRKLKTTK